jgi:hypothetical protein
MTTSDPINLPFRWHFLSILNPQTSLSAANWRAFTLTGEIVLESEKLFETRTECVADATQNGYRGS